MDRIRCFGDGDELYERYHDEEWGRELPDSPDERELFEKLSLEGFQAGLSWITVLRKRDAFRSAFSDFRPKEVAALGDADVEELMNNPGIIRNRAKIEAARSNAQALLRLHEQGLRLRNIVSEHAPPPRSEPLPSIEAAPASTPESAQLSKRLKSLGFRFVGPTTMYALMQSMGLVDDHIATCWLARPAQPEA